MPGVGSLVHRRAETQNQNAEQHDAKADGKRNIALAEPWDAVHPGKQYLRDGTDAGPVDKGAEPDHAAGKQNLDDKIDAVTQQHRARKPQPRLIAKGDDDGGAGVIAHARKIKQGNADGKKHNAKQHDKHAAQRQIAKAGKHGDTSGSW